MRLGPAAAGVVALTVALAGCGLDVQSADVFLITRTGQGTKLTVEVNNSGTVRCNGGHARPLDDSLLIAARDLGDNLVNDASENLKLPSPAGTIYTYRFELQQGTVTFADRDVAHHPTLAQAALLTTQLAQQVCGLS